MIDLEKLEDIIGDIDDAADECQNEEITSALEMAALYLDIARQRIEDGPEA